MTWGKFTAPDRRFGIPEWVALFSYAVLVAWLTVHHEPWADEAQAWLLARDNSFGGMLRQMHYEGSPALWHMLLWMEARLHLPYAAMSWTSSGFGFVSAFLLLRYSPLPRWARLLLPFGAFLLFHAPIVARSYGLSILLMLGLAALYRSQRHLLPACILCGLLGNTSLYGFIAAVGFAVLLLVRALRSRQQYAVTGLLAVCGLLCIALQQATPAPDAEFNLAGTLNRIPGMRHAFAVVTGVPVNPDAIRIMALNDAAAAADAKIHPVVDPEGTTIPQKLVTQSKRLTHVAIFSVSSSAVVALLLYLGLLAWLYIHHKMHLAFPLGLLLVIGNELNYTEHHILVVWGAFVATLWMAWPDKGDQHRFIDPAFSVILLLVLVEQCGWAVNVSRQDVYGNFDPGTQLAAYLREHPYSGRVDTVTYYQVSAQPYMVANPFGNVAKPYWPWAIGKEPVEDLKALVQDHPEAVVASSNNFGNAVIGNALRTHIALGQPFYSAGVVSRLEALGFRETHRFCGRQPMHFGYAEENCLVILEPGSR